MIYTGSGRVPEWRLAGKINVALRAKNDIMLRLLLLVKSTGYGVLVSCFLLAQDDAYMKQGTGMGVCTSSRYESTVIG